MGDRTTVWFRFSGQLKRSQVDEFVAALEAAGVEDEDGQYPPKAENVGGVLMDEECNYAHPEEMIGLARHYGLSYIYWWAAGGGYGSGYELHYALVDHTEQCMADHDLEPAMNLAELTRMQKSGQTLEDAIARLKRFDKSEEILPPLEIIED